MVCWAYKEAVSMTKLIIGDVHESQPIVQVAISRVGITGFKRPITVKIGKNDYKILANIDVYVDIPANKKGAHMSRNIEAIEEVFENGDINYLWKDVGEYAIELSKAMVEKHPYAKRVEVKIRAEIPLEKFSPVRKVRSFDTVNILVGSVATVDDKLDIRKILGVELEGMTVCPNSYKMTADYSRIKLREAGFTDEEIERILELVPLSAHNQRGRGRIIIETGHEIEIDLKDLVDILEDGMSSPVYPVLKREDEQHMVINAHKRPRFTEDVVRVVVGKLVEKFYSKLPDDTYVVVSQTNFESIHSHDVYSEIRGCFCKLAEEIIGIKGK